MPLKICSSHFRKSEYFFFFIALLLFLLDCFFSLDKVFMLASKRRKFMCFYKKQEDPDPKNPTCFGVFLHFLFSRTFSS